MKSILRIYLVLVLIIISSSCSKVVEDFPLQVHEPQIVINGMAQSDSVFSFMIARTAMRNNLNMEWSRVTPTELELLQNGSNVNVRYSSDSNLFVADNIHVKPLDKFDINVSVNGLETAQADLTVPDSTSFSVENIKITKEESGTPCYDCPPDYVETIIYNISLSVLLDDAPATDNFYSIKIERASYTYIMDDGEYKYTNDFPPPDPENYVSVDSILVFNPVEISSWDGIYEFKNDYGLYTNTDITEETGGNILYFKDQLLPGLKNQISFSSDNFYFYTDVDILNLRITLTSYTKDMFYYLRSLASYNSYYDFPLSEPIYIYTNIKNGRGIFGAASQTSRSLTIKPD
ncbi:DUF4249 family protein [Saccharicrinis sp. FJH2]|uniref:DUF4249 family protein n=1 Tax=Saccharicrinis sp. FJH65 TaxID=3344659 RepID=UPI0035F2C556